MEKEKVMDIHRIRCFLSLAELMNFTRAAEKQCITQSSMSQQIQGLENEIGVQLFVRNKRNVMLTPAGEFLKQEFLELIEKYEVVLAQTRRIANRENNHLSICYHGPPNWAFLLPIIQKFQKENEDFQLELSVENWGEMPNGLITRQFDVAFVEGAEIVHNNQIESFYLYRDYTCFAMHTSHPLARKTKLTEEDIKGEQIVMVDQHVGAKSMHGVHERLFRSGVDMSKVTLVKKFENCMAMVSSGMAIVPMPRSFREPDQSKIVYIDYDRKETYTDIYIAWLKCNTTPSLFAFIEFIKDSIRGLLPSLSF